MKFKTKKILILLAFGIIFSLFAIISNNFSSTPINHHKNLLVYPEDRLNLSGQDSREIIGR